MPNPRLDEIHARVFGPLGIDMAQLSATYSPEQLLTIADFLRRTTDILVANIARVGRM